MYRKTELQPVNKRQKAVIAKIGWIQKRINFRGSETDPEPGFTLRSDTDPNLQPDPQPPYVQIAVCKGYPSFLQSYFAFRELLKAFCFEIQMNLEKFCTAMPWYLFLGAAKNTLRSGEENRTILETNIIMFFKP